MRRALSFIAVICVLVLVPAVIEAVPITISGTGNLGSFTGTFDFVPTDDTSGTVAISLTNTSPAANGGFITAFVFNIPAGADVTSAVVASSDGDFDDPGDLLGGPSFLDSVNGAPFGQFDIGGSTGGAFEGGGKPTVGIPAGGSATFTFSLTGTGLSSLTAASFLSALSAPPGAGGGIEDFVVRFRGFNNGGSDKVPNNGGDEDVPGDVPEPSTSLILTLGLALLSTFNFRFGRK